MKSIVMPKNVALPEETKKQLEIETPEVKETLAKPLQKDHRSKFTAVDMWNCQRQSRSASAQIRRWNLN